MSSRFLFFNFLQAKSYKLKAIFGFTLIEMLVVISIFMIMTTVILANLPAFRDKTALDLIAQEIAITIRQAQVYGIGTRATGITFPSYGLYFNIGGNAVDYGLQDKKSFILFADTSNNNSSHQYDQGSGCGQLGTECVDKFTIQGGATIFGLVGCPVASCDSAGAEDLTDGLTINFRRPYPEASFLKADNTPGLYSYVKILVGSTRDQGNKREIDVWSTGQISVQNIST